MLQASPFTFVLFHPSKPIAILRHYYGLFRVSDNLRLEYDLEFVFIFDRLHSEGNAEMHIWPYMKIIINMTIMHFENGHNSSKNEPKLTQLYRKVSKYVHIGMDHFG